MDIAGKGGHVIMTWDGLVHGGVAGLVHSGLGGRSSKGSRDSRFIGSGTFPISSGSIASGKMTGGLVVGLVAGPKSKDTTVGVGKKG